MFDEKIKIDGDYELYCGSADPQLVMELERAIMDLPEYRVPQLLKIIREMKETSV